MAKRKIRIKVSRTFNTYTAGDELLVHEDDPEVQQLVAAKLFVVLDDEQPEPEQQDEPQADAEPAPKPKAKAAKGKARSSKKAKG